MELSACRRRSITTSGIWNEGIWVRGSLGRGSDSRLTRTADSSCLASLARRNDNVVLRRREAGLTLAEAFHQSDVALGVLDAGKQKCAGVR
jgi:hypothetical protein